MNFINIYKNENTYLTGFFLVFFAGLFWSFGVPTVRYLINAHDFVFNICFTEDCQFQLY